MMTIFRHTVLALMLVPDSARASDFQDLGAVDATAAAVAGGAVRPVDRRLKLAACPEPLHADLPALGAVAVRCASLGWRVRVLIDSASVPLVTAPIVIKRGDPVTVNFIAPGFSVTASGIAESEARLGERVRVRVDQKANPVMGEATDAGSVRVGGIN